MVLARSPAVVSVSMCKRMDEAMLHSGGEAGRWDSNQVLGRLSNRICRTQPMRQIVPCLWREGCGGNEHGSGNWLKGSQGSPLQ